MLYTYLLSAGKTLICAGLFNITFWPYLSHGCARWSR